jgi:hypothetical protein
MHGNRLGRVADGEALGDCRHLADTTGDLPPEHVGRAEPDDERERHERDDNIQDASRRGGGCLALCITGRMLEVDQLRERLNAGTGELVGVLGAP